PAIIDSCDNMFNNSALMLAAEKGHHEVVLALLEEKATIGLQNKRSETALTLAAKNGFYDVYASLRTPDKIEQKTTEGGDENEQLLADIKKAVGSEPQPLLIWAIKKQKTSAVSWLLKRSTAKDIEALDDKSQRNALMVAVAMGDLEKVRLFAKYESGKL